MTGIDPALSAWQLAGLGIDTGVDLGKLVETSTWLAARLNRPSSSPMVQAFTPSVC
ncbi:hypothetical protein ACIBF6_36265 [Streptosporangium amethystogenes]|uniref:hypothetical protein n=1 Tax=Streptosporangium amethystogenes TaxID=2002 RepID=UPI003797E569